jgi:hypothetical protein
MRRTAPIAMLAFVCAAALRAADPSDYLAAVSALQPGDTLVLTGGTYAHNLQLSGLNGRSDAWITIVGPADGSAVFTADDSHNTVELTNCSFVAVRQLTLDGQHRSAPFGVSAKNGVGNLTHDILIEGCTIRDYDGSQQTVGVSTKCPTWNWTIRGNRILHAGTGLYLGNSDGSCPFVSGVIEGNLVLEPIGYDMEVKWQAARPSVAGMPTGPSRTIIRHNVFVKDDRASPDGDRPNLLVGGFPSSGAGAADLYEIYGNLLHHNPRESLLQASGRVAIHDNLFVDVAGTAVLCANHDLPLSLAHVYHNTILSAGTGIWFGSAAPQGDAVAGNLVFAGTPIGGAIANAHDNIVDTVAHAGLYLTDPTLALGTLDCYPLPGTCTGAPIDLAPFAAETDSTRDFNGTGKGTVTYRGAYAGSGVNPGWSPDDERKPVPGGAGGSAGTGSAGGMTAGSGAGGGSHSGCGLGGGTALALGIALASLRRRRHA